jgi:hypothetical protein
MSKTRWLVVLAALCLLVTALAVAYAAGVAKSAVPVQELVRAQRFEVVDSLGRTRAVLGAVRTDDGNEEVSLSIVGRGGSVVAELETKRLFVCDYGELTVYGNSPRQRESATLGGYGPALTLDDDVNGECNLSPAGLGFYVGPTPSMPVGSDKLGAEELAKSWAAFSAALDARSRISLSVSRNGLPQLTLSDGEGRGRAVLSIRDGRPWLSLSDEDGTCRAVLGSVGLETVKTGETRKTAESSLVLFDKEGKVLWQAP